MLAFTNPSYKHTPKCQYKYQEKIRNSIGIYFVLRWMISRLYRKDLKMQGTFRKQTSRGANILHLEKI